MNKKSNYKTSPIPAIIVWTIAIAITAIFCWILSDILVSGMGQLSWEFFTTPPKNAGREGGISSIIVSSLLILGVCMAVSLPIGVGTAALLAEFTSTESVFGRWVRRSLDVLAGVPSIVFGLFGNAFFSIALGLGFSILSDGLTLACMVLPILIRSSEEGFRAVRSSYRLGAAALGLSRTTTFWQILLPVALSCHAFKLGISSEQDARTTRISPLLTLRFKCRTAYQG